MSGAGNQGLPARTLVGIIAAGVLAVLGVSFARKNPRTVMGPSSVAPDPRLFDPELYRGSISFLEAAVYTNAGVERLPESAHTLAQAVMAKNAANPMVRPIVLELETRLNRLAQMGGNSPEAVQAWEAIRREYFKPAAWLHAPAGPAPQ